MAALCFHSDYWEHDTCHSPAVDIINSSEVSDALFGFVHDPPVFTLDDILNTATPDHHRVPHHCAKRHRGIPHCIPPPPPTTPLDRSPFEPFFFAETPPQLPPLPLPVESKGGEDYGGGGGLSAQSVAARERRKRISEKTQQLSRLIPGGGRMNTAEMLQAGSKYVRYLQAQTSILGLMMNSKKVAESGAGEESLLQVLMGSEAIQERLSSRGMCLVPKEMVSEFAADPNLNPIVKRELNKFIMEPISEKKQ